MNPTPCRVAVIRGVSTYVPETVVTNEQIARREIGWTAEEIFAKTGIRERRVAAVNECASDLAAKAAERLIAAGAVRRSEVDYVLFCTQSPDHFLPATACLLQDRLGLPTACGALDFNHGCTGYVAGLSLAKGLVASGQALCVLLLTGETYSKFVHPRDRSVCTLFGDGASATVIRASEDTVPHAAGIGEFVFGTDGSGGKQLIVKAGAARLPRSTETARELTDADGNVRTDDHLYMNGRDLFRFAIQTVPRAVAALQAKSGLRDGDIDFVILHQANRLMLDELVKRIPFGRDRVPYEFADVGNTVSATIPLVLERLVARGALRGGHRLLLIGFGVGYSWAGVDVTWN
jgi:3-oxoacyl-[acyl-carrier-protein] synthase-3